MMRDFYTELKTVDTTVTDRRDDFQEGFALFGKVYEAFLIGTFPNKYYPTAVECEADVTAAVKKMYGDIITAGYLDKKLPNGVTRGDALEDAITSVRLERLYAENTAYINKVRTEIAEFKNNF